MASERDLFRDAAFDQYFSGKRYLDMVTQKFGWDTRRHIEQMSRHRLRRKIVEEGDRGGPPPAVQVAG